MGIKPLIRWYVWDHSETKLNISYIPRRKQLSHLFGEGWRCDTAASSSCLIMHEFLHNSNTTPMYGTVHMITSIQMEFFCFHSRKGNYNMVFCVDTTFRTEHAGSKPFCIVTPTTGQKLGHQNLLYCESSEHNMEAADPSVLWYNLQDRTWVNIFFWNVG